MDVGRVITWTSNVQGWKSHSQFEFSSQLQSIDIYTPLRDEAGAFVGLNHEAVLYDAEAFVEPTTSSSLSRPRPARNPAAEPGDASPPRTRTRP